MYYKYATRVSAVPRGAMRTVEARGRGGFELNGCYDFSASDMPSLRGSASGGFAFVEDRRRVAATALR